MVSTGVRHALLLCVLAACYRDAAPATVENRPPPAPRVNPAVFDPVGFLPEDAELVMVVDARQVRGSTLWRLLEPMVAPRLAEKLDAVQASCGLEPLRSVTQISVGLEHRGDGVVVIRGLDRAAVMACIERMAGTDPRTTIVDGVVTTTTTGKQTSVFTFANSSTLVGVAGPAASAAQLATALRRGAPLRTSPLFGELIGKLDTRRAAWLVVSGKAEALEAVTAAGLEPSWVSLSVDLTDGFGLSGRMRLESADRARSLVALGQAQLATLKPMVDTLELTSDDVEVVLRLAMTTAQLESIVKLVGGFANVP